MLSATVQPFSYKRHEPEATLLYQVLAREWESWLADRQADTNRSPLPDYVTAEVEAYLRCGILDHGFVILSCDGCSGQVPVAFSCKRRGICPSCCAKRASEISTHLIDNVLPKVAYRQWVTTFPYELRYWLAASRELTSSVHQRVTAMIQLYYTDKAEERGIKAPLAGGVTFVQRFGSALNINVHFHTVALEGVYSLASGKAVFYQLPGPSDEEVADIVAAVAHAVIQDLRQRGRLAGPGQEDESLAAPPLDPMFEGEGQLAAATAASTRMRMAFGERAGLGVRRIGPSFGYEDEIAAARGKRCSSVNGFSIHANRYIGAKDRDALEKLLAYGARGPFSNQRLSLLDTEQVSGELIYTLKSPWKDGTEALLLSPAELTEKLVALIPPPYVHLSRYFGVLASNSKVRPLIVLRPDVKKGFTVVDGSPEPVRINWAWLLSRVFGIDVVRCGVCGSKLNPDSFEIVVDANVVARILLALGLYARAPARAPPRSNSLFDDIDQRYAETD